MRAMYLAAAVVVAVSGCQGSAGAEAGGSDTPTVNVLALEVGTCLNDVDQPLAQDLTEVPAVACTTPHQSEVFAAIDVKGTDYPGIDSLTETAVRECQVEFERFVGVEFSASALNFHYYYPTTSSWAVGDRSIYCVIFDPGVESVGTLRGAER